MMPAIGRHIISSDPARRTAQEQSIIDRLHAWQMKLKEFQMASPEYAASIQAAKEWEALPDNWNDPQDYTDEMKAQAEDWLSQQVEAAKKVQ